MKIPAFKLEEFWKKYEFKTPYLFCSSDAESWKLNEIVELADPESKKLWESLSLGYTESSGLSILREEVSRLYTSMGSDQVMMFAGAEEGIYCLMRTLIEPGDHVIVIDPCYQSLGDLPRCFGADMTRIALNAQNRWQLDLEEVEKAFRPDTKLLVINYPHNPTGAVLTEDVLERLIALARGSGAYIFCDEVYRYLEIDEAKRVPSMADAYEKGVALNVMSKAFGLAGLRIGWLASRDVEVLKKAESYKMYTSICNSAPSELLALMALRSKDKILKRNRKVVLDNLNILESFMKRHQDVLSWIPPQSGTMAVLELLLPVSIEQFSEELVEKMGVLVMPGSVFDLPGNFFRVGFGKKKMSEALERFEQFLTHYVRS